MVQYHAIRYELGVHTITPLPTSQGGFGWERSHHRHILKILRYWNRLIIEKPSMFSYGIGLKSRLTFGRQIWDYYLNLLGAY